MRSFAALCLTLQQHNLKRKCLTLIRTVVTTAILLIPCLQPLFAHAQNSLSDVVGIPPDAAIYPIPGLGFVNLRNGNLHIEMPIRVVKDRNGAPLTTNLIYDNSVWQPIQVPGPNGNPVPSWSASPASPQSQEFSTLKTLTSPYYQGEAVYQTQQVACGNSQITQYSNWQYTDWHNTVHPFPPSLMTEHAAQGTGCPDEPNLLAAATDGSGYYLEVSNYANYTVYDMHGNTVRSGISTDTNGNENAGGGFYDKLGRPTALSNGFTVSYKTIYVATNFGTGDVSFSPQVISSITLPGGRTYSFQYDDAGPQLNKGHYGSLVGITLPTGGQISITNEVVLGAGENPNDAVVVQQITTPDGTWNFSYGSKVTATAPADPTTGLAAQTTWTLNGSSQVVSIYPGSATGTPLRTITTQYGGPGQVSNVTTTLANNQSSHIAYTYADACTPRVSAKKEYDFSGSLLRETDVSYYTSASDNASLCEQLNSVPSWTSQYLQGSHHITDIPQSVTIYGSSGSSGSPVAQTNYTYDSTTLSANSGSRANSVLGLAVHDDTNFGSSMTVRGNPTVIQQMTVSGSFTTTTTNYYNILGEVIETVDGNGNPTYFDYTDSWHDSSCISSPVFAYPTTVTNALNQVSATTYNSCDGSVASVQDQNDMNSNRAGTVYTYDGLQRITNTSYPDGGNTAVNYGGSTIPEVITTTITATPSPSQVSNTTLDGLGRPSKSVAASGAIVLTTYDSLGRVRTVTNPYFSTSDPTYGTTTYSYDALGRTTIQKQSDGTSMLQWCYDGVATSGQSNCLSNKSSITSASWVDYMDEIGSRRQYVSDGLGRLTATLEQDGTTNLNASPSVETDY